MRNINRHIYSSDFEFLYWTAASLRDNITIWLETNFTSEEKNDFIVKISKLWDSIKFEPFAKKMLPLAVEYGDFLDFIRLTEYEYCWLAFRLLGTELSLLKSIIEKFEIPSIKIMVPGSGTTKENYYEHVYPDWLVLALSEELPPGAGEEFSYERRLSKATSLVPVRKRQRDASLSTCPICFLIHKDKDVVKKI